MPQRIEIIGETFGRWRVLEYLGSSKYQCECECGKQSIIHSQCLRRGTSQSCGCFKLEKLALRKTHGYSKTKTYAAWFSLKNRCLNPRYIAWKNYGGRGITVCERWLAYENFLADMGEAPEGLSLDRIDNNGDYEPGNCRWATQTEQVNNRRNNRFVMLNGVEMPLTKAIKHLTETAYKKYDQGLHADRRWRMD